MRGERPDHTLQPTALVNEAFLRLTARSISWQSRAHFLAVAATVMRQILIDHARARQARKRGGALLRAELLDPVGLVHSDPSRFLIIEQLIRRLGEFDRRAERLVELRYFTGCTLDEAARSLGVSPKTAHRDWEFARAWLEQQLRQSP
jgi:RNA polymerase sigma factor (TIGR02999 family)